jgi:hypothetical protein
LLNLGKRGAVKVGKVGVDAGGDRRFFVSSGLGFGGHGVSDLNMVRLRCPSYTTDRVITKLNM